MTIAEILQEELGKLRAEIVARYDNLGMRASGKFERETVVDVEQPSATRTVGAIIAPSHTYYMVHGRGPGKFPPRNNIIEWIRQKNISFEGITISSLAYLIARKIALEGTKTFQQGGSDVISAVVTPQRIQSILLRIQMETRESFAYIVTQMFKSLK